MGHVFFTSGGSESADSALRLARAHHVAAGRPERWKVIGRHPSYHGITLGALAAGQPRRPARRLRAAAPRPPQGAVGRRRRASPTTIEREGPDTVAAFLFEPITGAAGACLDAADDYWRAVEATCRRHGDPADRRRGDDGLRPHRPTLGSRPPPAAARHPVRRQGPRRRLRADRDGRGQRRGRRPARGRRVHVLHVHRQRRRLRRGVSRAAHPRRRASGRAVRGRSATSSPVCSTTPSATTRTWSSCAAGACSAASSWPGPPRSRPDASRRPWSRECLARDVWIYPAGSGPVRDAVMIGCPFTITEAELELLVDVLRESIDAAAATLARSG